MFSLNQNHQFYLYHQPTDMRKSFDGLSGLVITKLGRNPLSGEVFVFINRRRNCVEFQGKSRQFFKTDKISKMYIIIIGLA